METEDKTIWERLIEKTVGAVRHVMTKLGLKGYIPVGFSIVFYSPEETDLGEKWKYSLHTLTDPHNPPDLHDEKIKERVNLVNEFLSEGCKRILEGEIDDMMVEKGDIEGFAFQIPGVKGEV